MRLCESSSELTCPRTILQGQLPLTEQRVWSFACAGALESLLASGRTAQPPCDFCNQDSQPAEFQPVRCTQKHANHLFNKNTSSFLTASTAEKLSSSTASDHASKAASSGNRRFRFLAAASSCSFCIVQDCSDEVPRAVAAGGNRSSLSALRETSGPDGQVNFRDDLNLTENLKVEFPPHRMAFAGSLSSHCLQAGPAKNQRPPALSCFVA